MRMTPEKIEAANSLSGQAIAKQEEALAYLRSKGWSHDYASEQLRLKGADAVLAEKAGENADAA